MSVPKDTTAHLLTVFSLQSSGALKFYGSVVPWFCSSVVPWLRGSIFGIPYSLLLTPYSPTAYSLLGSN